MNQNLLFKFMVGLLLVMPAAVYAEDSMSGANT